MSINNSLNYIMYQISGDEEEFVSNNRNYGPTIPIAIYRELTEELKGTQNLLKRSEKKNQKLREENEKLKEEIELLRKKGEDLKKIVQEFEFNYQIEQQKREIQKEEITGEISEEKIEIREEKKPVKTKKKKRKPPQKITEIPAQNYGIKSESPPQEINGFLLGIAIIFIILTTLGTGFMVINTLLNQQNNN